MQLYSILCFKDSSYYIIHSKDILSPILNDYLQPSGEINYQFKSTEFKTTLVFNLESNPNRSEILEKLCNSNCLSHMYSVDLIENYGYKLKCVCSSINYYDYSCSINLITTDFKILNDDDLFFIKILIHDAK